MGAEREGECKGGQTGSLKWKNERVSDSQKGGIWWGVKGRGRVCIQGGWRGCHHSPAFLGQLKRNRSQKTGRGTFVRIQVDIK